MKRPPIINHPKHTPITSEEWKKKHRDFKGIHTSECGTYRYRTVLKFIEGKGTCAVPVFLSDKPEKLIPPTL